MPELEVARLADHINEVAHRVSNQDGFCQVWTDREGRCRSPVRVVYQNLDEMPEHFDSWLCCEHHRPLPRELYRVVAVVEESQSMEDTHA